METLRFLLTSSFYPPFHIGGDAVHVSYLADELARRGHEVHVLHSLDAYNLKRGSDIADKAQTPNNVTVHPVRSSLSLSAYTAFAFGSSPAVSRSFRELIDKIRPDVVHHHNISLLGYKLLRKRRNYLNLYTAHDYWLICPQSNLTRRNLQVCTTRRCTSCVVSKGRPLQLWRYVRGFARATQEIDALIAPSQYLRDRITRLRSIKSIIIPNFAPAPPSHLGASGFANFLVYVGVLEKHKGILALLDEYKDLADLSLIIVGKGTLEGRVAEFVRRNRLESSIFRLGWVSRDLLFALLQDAQALVIPSIWPENAPLVALEALSLGTPVVASDRGGLPEIVCNVDKELAFKWEDDGDLTRAIRYSLDHKEMLSKNARSVYQRHYTPDAYLASYMRLLDTVGQKREPQVGSREMPRSIQLYDTKKREDS